MKLQGASLRPPVPGSRVYAAVKRPVLVDRAVAGHREVRAAGPDYPPEHPFIFHQPPAYLHHVFGFSGDRTAQLDRDVLAALPAAITLFYYWQ